jgi:hypothetical protein
MVAGQLGVKIILHGSVFHHHGRDRILVPEVVVYLPDFWSQTEIVTSATQPVRDYPLFLASFREGRDHGSLHTHTQLTNILVRKNHCETP